MVTDGSEGDQAARLPKKVQDVYGSRPKTGGGGGGAFAVQ
jgi:hypothetical protein